MASRGPAMASPPAHRARPPVQSSEPEWAAPVEGGYIEYRCHRCGKLILIARFDGWVEAVCDRCKRRRGFVSRPADHIRE